MLENNYNYIIIIILQNFSRRIERSESHTRLPSPGVLHQKTSPHCVWLWRPVLCLVAQSCPTLCETHRLWPTTFLCPWGFSRQEYWRGLPCPPPGDLPHPEIEPRSLALQVDSLPSEPPGKPLWRPAGLNFVSLKGWDKYTSLLKVTYKISHPLEPREKAIIWQEVLPDLPAGLEEFPGGTGGGRGSSSGAGLWRQTFLEFPSTWCRC